MGAKTGTVSESNAARLFADSALAPSEALSPTGERIQYRPLSKTGQRKRYHTSLVSLSEG